MAYRVSNPVVAFQCSGCTVGMGRKLDPYSPIELYLAGLIHPEEVPDLWVAGTENFYT